MENRISQLSITTTVGKQTQVKPFGEVLSESLKSGVNALGTVSGLLGNVAGTGMVSAAVSSVSALTNAIPNRMSGTTSAGFAASGVTQVTGGNAGISTIGAGGVTASGINTGIAGGVPNELNGMVGQMRAEADRSIAVQMQMQSESRDYNALTNVLKTRHDSAKAAINNIR